MTPSRPDCYVIGSGPNGLVAAITMARAGRRVTVLEAASTPGGGCRTAELTVPGFRHDVCAAVLPMGLGSPAMRDLPLAEHGVQWVHPDVALAHPLDDGSAMLHRSIDATADGLGPDGDAWRRLLDPLLGGFGATDDLLSLPSLPHHPVSLARFARSGLLGAERVAAHRLTTPRGRALFAGLAAHSVLPLDRWVSSGVALTLAAYGHLVGWPVARGGSQAVTDALVGIVGQHGGTVECDHRVDGLDELPPDAVVIANIAPEALVRLAGDRLDARAGRRYGLSPLIPTARCSASTNRTPGDPRCCTSSCPSATSSE